MCQPDKSRDKLDDIAEREMLKEINDPFEEAMAELNIILKQNEEYREALERIAAGECRVEHNECDCTELAKDELTRIEQIDG